LANAVWPVRCVIQRRGRDNSGSCEGVVFRVGVGEEHPAPSHFPGGPSCRNAAGPPLLTLCGACAQFVRVDHQDGVQIAQAFQDVGARDSSRTRSASRPRCPVTVASHRHDFLLRVRPGFQPFLRSTEPTMPLRYARVRRRGWGRAKRGARRVCRRSSSCPHFQTSTQVVCAPTGVMCWRGFTSCSFPIERAFGELPA